MNAKELAEKLDGREYRSEITREECDQAEEHGLVVMFGASDDLVELRGAIDDEIDVWDGTTFLIGVDGRPENPCEEGDGCPNFKKLIGQMELTTIKAVWCAEEQPPWTYELEIPHETFRIFEDGELSCIGVVFELESIR